MFNPSTVLQLSTRVDGPVNSVKDITMIQKFILFPATAALIALTGCGTSPSNQQVGTGVGAVVGGVAGNAVFGGVLGTVGGAAAGAVIGNEVGKKK
jgi:osmotically inducible lipoprotein OsmB